MATDRPPTLPEFVLGSTSEYPFDRAEHGGKSSFAKSHIFDYPRHAGHHGTLDASRGPLECINRRFDGPIRGPDPDAEQVAPDARARAEIQRRNISKGERLVEFNEEQTRREREILRFLAFHEEPVPGNAQEDRRVRLYMVCFYPIDGTIRVVEPVQDNSGLVQGETIRRQLVPREHGSGNVGLDDLAGIGRSVSLFAREFTVVDADLWTRRWLQARGVELGEPGKMPAMWQAPSTLHVHDPARPTTVALDRGFQENSALGFYSRAPDRRGPYLKHHGDVLRFLGRIPASSAPGGEQAVDTPVVLHYYLEDESLELTIPRSWAGAPMTLLSRQRVPRPPTRPGTAPSATGAAASGTSATAAAAAGGGGAHTLERPSTAPGRARLGFLSEDEARADAHDAHVSRASAQRYAYSRGSWSGTFVSPITGQALYGDGGVHVDRLPRGPHGHPVAPVTHITPDMLQTGEPIVVFGRHVLLLGADDRTVAWYSTHMSRKQRSAAEIKAAERDGGRGHAPGRSAVPPFEGITAIGDEEETRRNARLLTPTWRRRPKLRALYEHDGSVLHFPARLLTSHPIESVRRFVVAFYLEDETLSIFEQAIPNSGIPGGKFLERGRYRNARAAPVDATARPLTPGTRPLSRADTVREYAMERARQLAVQRFGDDPAGAVLGYSQGYGQGVAGGVWGKPDIVCAGGAGVSLARGVGLGSAIPYRAPPRFFSWRDLTAGGEFELAHSPGQVFLLGEPGAGTRRLLRALEEDEGGAASDGEEHEHEHEHEGGGDAAVDPAVASVARVLVGVCDSLRQHLRSRDRTGAGAVSRETALVALRGYGAQPPLVPDEDVEAVLAQFASSRPVEDPRHPGHATRAVDYMAMCAALRGTLESMQHHVDRTAPVLGQLRKALLASRAHLRRMFIDLGREIPGVVSPAEFRFLLRRHHLDMGLTDRAVLRLMRRVPRTSGSEDDAIPIDDMLRFLVAIPGLPADEVDCRLAQLRRLVLRPSTQVVVTPPRRHRRGYRSHQVEESANEIVVEDMEDADDADAAHGDEGGVQEAAPRRDDAAGASGDSPAFGEGKCADSASDATSASQPNEREADAEEERARLVERMRRFFHLRQPELARTFALYDRAATGRLPMETVAHALESAGFSLRRREVQVLLADLAADRFDGELVPCVSVPALLEELRS